ncbi:MAG: hypothetical protein JWP00_2731 [Chloroflexi bacterium]|nr:hypothetical protein [Chloroflexota bacterium]
MSQTDPKIYSETLDDKRPISLQDYLRQARQTRSQENTSQFQPLAFLKKIKSPSTGKKAKLKAKRLPSGLTQAQALEIVSGLEAGLNLFKPGTAPYPDLDPAKILIRAAATGLQVNLVEGAPGQENNLQQAITRLFYRLTIGQELDPQNPEMQFKQLAQAYPHTAKVLRQGWQSGYNSTRQLSGAFGWSLFRWEHLPLTDAQIEAVTAASRPGKVTPARQLELPQPSENGQPAKGGLPGLLTWASLSLGLALIVAFLVVSAANPPVTAQTNPPTAAPSPTPAPNVRPGLVNTRQADGSRLTLFNPAYLPGNESKYTNPETLAPGQAALLSGQRPLRVLNAQWSLGQNVYLTLQDGGWEVWDTTSGSRISRRELPDAGQYAWVWWSPDGENFAAQGFDGKMRLGSAGKVLRTFAYTTGYYPGDIGFPLSWSPNSNYLLVRQGEGKYQFWNFQGNPQAIMPGPDQPFLDLNSEDTEQGFQGSWSWSGDSRYIAFFMGSTANTVIIFENRTLAKVATLSLEWQSQLPAGDIFADQYFGDNYASQGNFAWSPDGQYMALQRWSSNVFSSIPQSQRILTIWEVPANLLTRSNSNPLIPRRYQAIKLDNAGAAGLVEWSRDGRLLLNSRQTRPVNNSAVVKQNQLLVFDEDNERAFNWTNTYTIDLPGQPEQANGWWSPDGRRVLAGTGLNYLAIYQIPPPGEPAPAQALKIQGLSKNLEATTETAAPSPDGRWLATFSINTGPQLRDLTTGQLKKALPGPFDYGLTGLPMQWSPDSRYLAVVYSRLVSASYNTGYRTVARLWKFNKDKDQPDLYGDVSIASETAFIPATGWNLKSSEPELWFEKDQDRVSAWKQTGPPPDKQNPLETQAAGQLPGRSIPPGFWTAPKAWFPDWSAWVGPLDTTLDYGIRKLQPPGTNLAGSQAGEVIHLEPRTGEKAETVSVKATAISPDSRMVALGLSNGLIHLYDAANGKLFQAFSAHQAAVNQLGFAPDGKSLASASSDRTVKVWNTANWKAVSLLRGQSQPVNFLQWLPDGKTLLAGNTANGTSMVMWRVS